MRYIKKYSMRIPKGQRKQPEKWFTKVFLPRMRSGGGW